MFASQVRRAANSSVPTPSVSVSSRAAQQEAMILGVIAENGLPFSMGQVIIETTKELMKDPHALDKVALSSIGEYFQT